MRTSSLQALAQPGKRAANPALTLRELVSLDLADLGYHEDETTDLEHTSDDTEAVGETGHAVPIVLR